MAIQYSSMIMTAVAFQLCLLQFKIAMQRKKKVVLKSTLFVAVRGNKGTIAAEAATQKQCFYCCSAIFWQHCNKQKIRYVQKVLVCTLCARNLVESFL